MTFPSGSGQTVGHRLADGALTLSPGHRRISSEIRMNIDPQFAPFLEGAAQFPKANSIPAPVFRDLVRQASTGFPKLEVPLGAITDRTIPGPGGDLPVRIYTPIASAAAPVIVYFHGGGYIAGDLDTQDMICRGLCNGARSVVVSVAYRLAPENPFPAAHEDCWAATLWAAGNACEIGGIPGQLAVAGDSAGADLAAGVALRARDAKGPALCGQVLIYGAGGYPSGEPESMRENRNAPFLHADDVLYFWHQYLSNPEVDQHDLRASPGRASSLRDVAPALIVTAEADPLRDFGEGYGRKLVAAGVSVQMRRYPGMVHGFLSWLGVINAAHTAMNDASAWLRTQFARAAGG